MDETSEQLYYLKSALEFEREMEKYGNWVAYFTRHIVVHGMKKRGTTQWHNKKVTWPLVLKNIEVPSVKFYLQSLLLGYLMTIDDLVDANKFVEQYCPHSNGDNINLKQPPPSKFIDNRYDKCLELVIAAVIKGTN